MSSDENEHKGGFTMTHSNPTLEQVTVVIERCEQAEKLLRRAAATMYHGQAIRQEIEQFLGPGVAPVEQPPEVRGGEAMNFSKLGICSGCTDTLHAESGSCQGWQQWAPVTIAAPPPTDAPDMTYEDPRILGTFWAVLDLATGDLCIDGMAQLKTGKTVMAIYPNKPNAAGCDLVQRVEVRCVGNSKPDAPLPESPVSYALKAEAFNTIQLDHNDLRGLFLITKPYMCEDGRSWPGGPAVSLSAAASAIDQLCEDLAKAIAIGQDACRRADSWITREAEQQPVPAEQPTDAPGVDLEAASYTMLSTLRPDGWPLDEGNVFKPDRMVPLSVAQAALADIQHRMGNRVLAWQESDERQRTRAEAAETALATAERELAEWRNLFQGDIADPYPLTPQQAWEHNKAVYASMEETCESAEREAARLRDELQCEQGWSKAFQQSMNDELRRAETAQREAAGLRERVAYFEKAFYYLNRKLCGFSDKDLAALAKQANTDGEVWEDGA
jgi:hypothetical protein